MIIIRVLRFVIIGILIYFLLKLLWRGLPLGVFRKKKKPDSPGQLEEMKKDPVCGTYIPESQAIRLNWKKETVYFCSKKCRDEFQKLHH